MRNGQVALQEIIRRLSHTVAVGISFFATAPEDLHDGYQTSREALSHLVFWHREYVDIIDALHGGHAPVLRQGKFRELNALAYAEFRDQSVGEMLGLLSEYQARLVVLLESGMDPQLKIAVKQGGHAWEILELLDSVDSHIRSHVMRLKKAQQAAIRRRG